MKKVRVTDKEVTIFIYKIRKNQLNINEVNEQINYLGKSLLRRIL